MIHKRLIEAYGWYKKWHENKHHHVYHWTLFVGIALLCTNILTLQISTIDYSISIGVAEVQAADNLPNRLLQPTDLVYQGAFRLPGGQIGSSTFDYGGYALTFNSARSSLFAVGINQGQVAEVSIPSALGSGNIDQLPVAKLLQTFTDVTEGRKPLASTDPNGVGIGGLLPYQGKLYATVYTFYAGDSQRLSHFVSGLDFTVQGDVQGPFRVQAPLTGMISGYFGLVPVAWQVSLGGPVLNGQCCINIISRTSYGPALFAINPTDIGITDPVPSTPLVYYPETNKLSNWGAKSTLFNGTTQIAGVVFPEGTRSVLLFGRHGLGDFCYGAGTTDIARKGFLVEPCYDPDNQDKGNHAFPYVGYVWTYDAQDLAAAKAGTKQPWEVKPYAVWELPQVYPGGNVLRGASYDPATGRIFVSQAGRVVHVYTISSPGTLPPADTLPTVVIPTINISTVDAVAAEPHNNSTFTITRTGATSAALTANYTISGTATNGVDYTNLPLSINIPAGLSSQNINLSVLDDLLVEGGEAVTLTLSLNSSYILGTNTSATVIIGDNEPVTVVDTIPPTISLITSSNITSTGATITWTTNEAATSNLQYGLSTSYGSVQNSGGSTSHSVTLSGLSPNTLYNYRISTSDTSLNTLVSGNQTFTTTQAVAAHQYQTPAPDSPSATVTVFSDNTTPINITTPTVPVLISGCTGTTGFSVISGKSCAGSSYNFGFTTLRLWSRGEAVKELQRFLNDTLNLSLVVDGKLGLKTIAVVRQWQRDNGLVSDGLVGPKTKATMNVMAQ